jgi:DNA modification methylase
MRLSDNEIRDITKLLEEGKPLPDEYRFLLFQDKREVELVWQGKTNEVSSVVLPFQVIEQVDEPRAENAADAALQGSLFDARGRQLKGWTNKLIWGDNKLILSSLKNGPMRDEIERQGGLKLIYIDPPFDVGADFSMDIEVGDGGDTFTKRPNILEEIAYRDTWGKGADSFIAMIYERLILMRDLLAEDGSIFLHCDWRVSPMLRMSFGELFGAENFRNEIYWYYYNKMPDTRKGQFPRATDTILWYTKNSRANYKFEPLVEKREKAVKQLKRVKVDGRMTNARDEAGNVLYNERAERVVDNVWRLSMLQPADKTQNLGYATQKPESLVDRIIRATSNPGDLVADFFVGSGTTAAVAEKLGRKWIATDLGKFAIHTTRKRMIGVQRQLKAEGKDYRAFEILNLGKYERQHYIGVNPSLREEQKQQQLARKEAAFCDLILRAYRAEKTDGFLTFHGKKAGRLVAIGPVNLPVTRLFVEEIILECRQKHITKVDLLGFEFEMGLFPNVLDEARGKGIDIAPKYIPAEVFDKRAVEKNQVVFHDVAYIEVKPHLKRNSVAVELTDFSVFYSQDSIANAEATLKNKSSKIVVEKGQIVKVSKDADGIVKREVLTQRWTDWIDYWAVDFNFENKRELIRQQNPESGEWEEVWTGEYVFENEWQSFRTKKNRELELTSVFHQCQPGRRKVAVKVVDIFGNDTMTIVPVTISDKD